MILRDLPRRLQSFYVVCVNFSVWAVLKRNHECQSCLTHPTVLGAAQFVSTNSTSLFVPRMDWVMLSFCNLFRSSLTSSGLTLHRLAKTTSQRLFTICVRHLVLLDASRLSHCGAMQSRQKASGGKARVLPLMMW